MPVPYRTSFMKLRPIAFAIVLVLASAGAAAEVSDYERFQLDNGCFPFQLEVRYSEKEAGSFDLSKERIETVVRSRLRAARLYEEPSEWRSGSFLHVDVKVASTAFSFGFSFHKLMREVMSISRMASEGQHLYQSVTWQYGGTGTYARTSDIISTVSEATDHFIDEFLRVNDATCGKTK